MWIEYDCPVVPSLESVSPEMAKCEDTSILLVSLLDMFDVPYYVKRRGYVFVSRFNEYVGLNKRGKHGRRKRKSIKLAWRNLIREIHVAKENNKEDINS